jgi:hypothetical protein
MFGKKRNIIQSIVLVDFSAVNTELVRFKTHVQQIDCPACKQNTLLLDKYEQDPKTWKAQVSCSNCNFSGLISNDGFSFTDISSKGKAVDKR